MADRPDAVVVGAGHNGLVCAAYLARAGLDVVVLEARDTVGGCASTVDAIGARVNICNCDHLLVRTTPIVDELDLAAHGLTYLDVDPAQMQLAWSGGPAWPVFHDPDRTIDALRALNPADADGYRRYVAAARPVAELVTELAGTVPTAGAVSRRILERRARGVATLLRWSRMSCVDVLRSFFVTDAVIGPQATTGPAVWGISPAAPGTGLGAIGYALKHVGQTGRPRGGSGGLPTALAAAITRAGGCIRTAAPVAAVDCTGAGVHGVALTTGETIATPRVVVACDPRVALARWLRDPPAAARPLVARWRAAAAPEGYESKLDAVVTRLPRYRQFDSERLARLGVEDPLAPTTIVAPPVHGIVAAHTAAFTERRVADQPMFYVNLPSVRDASMQPAPGEHLLSLEVLFTPYRLAGGWESSAEPDRWIEAFGSLVEPGFVDGIRDRRVMTPPRYESEFHLPQGHATSFPGGPVAALLGRRRELSRYRTPVRGLYVTGAATFPGAGVWGASGRNAAHVILRDANRPVRGGRPA